MGFLTYKDHKISTSLKSESKKSHSDLVKSSNANHVLVEKNNALGLANKSLSEEIRKISLENSAILTDFGQKLMLEISNDCLADQKSLIDSIKKQHQAKFTSDEESAEEWAVNFLNRISITNNQIQVEHSNMMEVSDRSLPNLAIMLEFIQKLFIENANHLSKQHIIKDTEIYVDDFFNTLRFSGNRKIKIIESTFANDINISIFVNSRIISKGILSEHPYIYFIASKNSQSKQLFTIKGPRVKYSYTGGITYIVDTPPLKTLEYQLDKDYLADAKFVEILRDRVKSVFEIAYSSL
ncbi:hypothetical protein [Desulfosediminicola flagellatus]|uniref:hypothetical protein n=1 Tax=Desulfosediminicola flagellatus TaxID=2569541 RepID=UPI0010AB8202|nr:hypothetical protein [Desulfosediminicola flagellatus]